jgi:hypothetical protein
MKQLEGELRNLRRKNKENEEGCNILALKVSRLI